LDSFSAAATALDIRQEAIKNYLARNQQKPYKGRYILPRFNLASFISLPSFLVAECLLVYFYFSFAHIIFFFYD